MDSFELFLTFIGFFTMYLEEMGNSIYRRLPQWRPNLSEQFSALVQCNVNNLTRVINVGGVHNGCNFVWAREIAFFPFSQDCKEEQE